VLIRPAHSEDIEEVLALWSDAEAEPTHTDNAASLQLLLRHDPGSLLVSELDGRVVGTVISGWDGWRGSIYRLVVHPRHRRQGLARQLPSEAESRLTKLGSIGHNPSVYRTFYPERLSILRRGQQGTK
jgi:ribosomal protein S18 acetylase RimI-like enzyme